jgi:hypothetical protein
MKRINIAGTTITTGTELADALLELWIGLARLHRLEIVEIPFIDDDGSRQSAQLVLCSAVPIWTSTVAPRAKELTDATALAELRSRAAELVDLQWGPMAVEFGDG